jgi:hypothetical protein
MGNTFLKNLVGFKADDEFVILAFQKFIKVRRGKSGVPSEIAAQVPFPVTLNDRFQNAAPAVGAVDVAGAKRTPFQIAKLVKQEKVSTAEQNQSRGRRKISPLDVILVRGVAGCPGSP